jgi:hypothetical protein
MGPLQVLGMSVVERMYDGQMCLAQKTCNIVWQVCLSITPQWLNTDIPDIVWQVLRDDPSVVPSGCMTWIIMLITCEPITYFMLNGLEIVMDHRITCEILYVYIKIYDILTDLKGSERPRITVIYSNFLGYGSLFGQGSIPTNYHFSPLSPQNDAGICTITKY